MTRMTGPDCVVMCNLINTYIHTYIYILQTNAVLPRYIVAASSPTLTHIELCILVFRLERFLHAIIPRLAMP